MRPFEHFVLKNGLELYVIEEENTSTAVINILYDVGSRDEDENQTGFAHLFEHLMFGGSKNVPEYDREIQMLAGDNNAFTTTDITNYYTVVPGNNLEAALRIESDRMLALTLNQNVLDVQKGVVEEEFKQRYLSQPYGDVWFHLRSLAYQVHPYQWPTIGKNIDHIRSATMDTVRSFYETFYLPNNAIMVVAGKVKANEVYKLSEKWFGPIPAGRKKTRNLPQEPLQQKERYRAVEEDVPVDSIYKVFHGPARTSGQFYDMDVLGDVLTSGQSSILYSKLVKELKLLSGIKATMMSAKDPGLFYIQGKLNSGVGFDEVEDALGKEIESILERAINEKALIRTQNKAEASLVFNKIELLNRAMSLAIFANMGKPELFNNDIDNVMAVTPESIKESANQFLRKTNSSTVHYKRKNND